MRSGVESRKEDCSRHSWLVEKATAREREWVFLYKRQVERECAKGRLIFYELGTAAYKREREKSSRVKGRQF